MAEIVYCDFETEAIGPRPAEYPPKPVGVAILRNGKSEYKAWGHPTGNNCTYEEGLAALSEIWNDPSIEIVCHNTSFDASVAIEKMGLPELPWHRLHDTLFLAFLNDPHSKSLSLKELAAELCDIPPTERDEVRDWVLANVKGSTKAKFGAHIAKAPGDLVGKYAETDVFMTKALFELLHPRIVATGMQEAYDRERQLLPILMENSRLGIPVDVPALRADVASYSAVIEELSAWILARLEVTDPAFNIDSDAQMAEALSTRGLVTEWVLTEKGKKSMSADALKLTLSDKDLFGALQYRGVLTTCVHTFMANWLATAEMSGGNIFTSWNQVRGEGHGARTGRMSSNPNMQNIPSHVEDANRDRPAFCPELPNVRKYIIAPPGYVLLGRDYSSQEVRVFAHYEGADIMNRYLEDPSADMHQFIADMITASGVPTTRRQAKTILFLTFYGGGAAKLAGQLGISEVEAKKLKDAFIKVFPGLKELNNEMRVRERYDDPIRTLGGRLYYAETPKEINGRLCTFGYKLLNVLIQGGSADMTKEATIRYHNTKGSSRLLLSVHDELIILCPEADVVGEMQVLKQAMESVELSVPVLSSGEAGTTWFNMKEYVDV